MKDNVPNPGSDEALEMGCSCPVIDNNYGRGSYKGGGFIISMSCPIHEVDFNEE